MAGDVVDTLRAPSDPRSSAPPAMSLSSLIVQREVATIRQVEEALARQVLYGGDLVTNVLEVAQVPEEVLVPLLAETAHMPHAPLRALPPPSQAAHALVPTDL